jgi:hypothetical protein
MGRDPPVASAAEASLGIYGGFTQGMPSGDVARPVQIKETIPGLNLAPSASADSAAAEASFEQMFGGANPAPPAGISAEAQKMLDMGVPIEAVPPALLVPPPTDDQKAWRSWSKTPGKKEAPLPSSDEVMRMDEELRSAYEQEKRERDQLARKEEEDAQRMIIEIQKKQEERRKQFEREDAAKLAKLE